MPVHGAELGTEVCALLLQEVTRETLTVQGPHCRYTAGRKGPETFYIGKKNAIK